MATLIGTLPNFVIQNALLEADLRDCLFSFALVGSICKLIGNLLWLHLSRIFLVKKGAEAGDLKKKHGRNLQV